MMGVKVVPEANQFQGLEVVLEVVEAGHVPEVILVQDHPLDVLDQEVILALGKTCKRIASNPFL